MEKEEIKQNVAKILEEFVKQEMGNRITSFNMQGLTNIILNVIDNGIQTVNQDEQQ